VKVICYSSFTFSYLNRARVLYSTLRRFHPDWDLVALVTDRPPAGFRFDPTSEPFDRLVYADDLAIPDFKAWLFKHDVVEACTAVKGPFLHQALGSGADAVMVGRGVYGRPWIAAQIEAALDGRAFAAPEAEPRLAIALDHFNDSLKFYGDRLGLRIFRKHLAAYVENAPWPNEAEARRSARSTLCRLEDPGEVERGLIALWRDPQTRLAA